MKVALAQINCTVGDIDGNTALIVGSLERARDAGAHLVVFPELAVFGYPPKDLLLREDLIQRNVEAIERIAAQCTGIILAKLDGTAKGGVVVAIRQTMGIPVKYVGVGENIDDIELLGKP